MMSNPHIGHKERKKQRAEEQKRLMAIDKQRKSKQAAAHRRRKLAILKTKIINIFTLEFFCNDNKNNKPTIQQSSHDRRIKEHLKQKRRAQRTERIKEFINHPFGRSKTEFEKQKLLKEQQIAKRIKRKNRLIRLAKIKSNILFSLSSIRNASVRHKLIKQLIPSTVAFMIAYISIFTITNVATAWIASLWDIRTRIETSIIYFEPSPYSPLWTKGSVVSIYTTQVILSFIISLTALWLFTKSARKSSFVKSILIWQTLLGQAFTWGAFLGAFIRKKEVYHAIIWGFYETWFDAKTILVVLMGGSFIWLLIFGYLIKPALLFTSSSAELLKSKNRPAFFYFQYMIPFALSTILIFFINSPVYNIYLFIQLFSLLIIFTPLLFDNSNNKTKNQIKIVRSPINNYLLIAGALILIILFKIIFNHGIPF